MDEETFLNSIMKNKSLSNTVIITILGYLIYRIYNRLFNNLNTNESRRKSSNKNLENLENISNIRNQQNTNVIQTENKNNDEKVVNESYNKRLILVWNNDYQILDSHDMLQYLKELKIQIYLIVKTNLTDISQVKNEMEKFNVFNSSIKNHVSINFKY